MRVIGVLTRAARRVDKILNNLTPPLLRPKRDLNDQERQDVKRKQLRVAHGVGLA